MSHTNHLHMPKNNMDSLYHAANPLVRFVHVQRLDKIIVQIPKNSTRILDAGFGTNSTSDLLEGKMPQMSQ